jgi:Flp pilus assembly CpaE family ATPase
VANKTEARRQLSDLEERLGEPVSARLPLDPQARRADALGQALLDHAPESEAVKAISELTDRLVDSTT